MFMFRYLLVAGVVLAVGVTARADPNMPQRARLLRVELVRAYGPCTAPNESIIGDTAVQTCGPVQPLSSEFKFGGKGHGRVQVGMGGMFGNFVRLQVDLQDVRDTTTTAGIPVGNVKFSLEYSLRVTTNFCAAGDVCTTTQLVKHLDTRVCSKGRCFASGVVDLGGFLTDGFDASIEVGQIKVLDPNGKVFAVQGIGRNSSE